MDTVKIRAQAGLMRQFADRNSAHVADVALAPDCSEMTVKLRDVPLIFRDGAGRLTVGREHTLRFVFDNSYPIRPPIFSIGPHRPVCSHIWRNGTVCLLQPVWYDGFELPSAIIDLVGMLQGEEQLHGRGADPEDSRWLADSSNFRLRREMVGAPTRFVGLSWGPPPAVSSAPTPTPTRPAVRLANSIGGSR